MIYYCFFDTSIRSSVFNKAYFMNRTISFSTKSLCRFIAVFFLTIATQSVAATNQYFGTGIPVPTAAEFDIQSVDANTLLMDFFKEGSEDAILYFRTYRNLDGRNLAFIAADKPLLLKKMQDVGVDVVEMLKEKNSNGNDGMSRIEGILKKEADNLETKLKSLTEPLEIKKIKGNYNTKAHRYDTIIGSQLSEQIEQYRIQQSSLQQKHESSSFVEEKEYLSESARGATSVASEETEYEFERTLLDKIKSLNANPNNNLQHTITTYDLPLKERSDEYRRQLIVEPSRRVHQGAMLDLLGTERFKKALLMKTSTFNISTMDSLHILQLDILTTGGRFGINFRTALSTEADIMLRNLESLAQVFYRTNTQLSEANNTLERGREIANIFFAKYSGDMTPEQEFRLEDHQTNCAVMTLAFSHLFSFDDIDTILEKRLLMKDKKASYYKSSLERFNHVNAMSDVNERTYLHHYNPQTNSWPELAG